MDIDHDINLFYYSSLIPHTSVDICSTPHYFDEITYAWFSGLNKYVDTYDVVRVLSCLSSKHRLWFLHLSGFKATGFNTLLTNPWTIDSLYISDSYGFDDIIKQLSEQQASYPSPSKRIRSLKMTSCRNIKSLKNDNDAIKICELLRHDTEDINLTGCSGMQDLGDLDKYPLTRLNLTGCTALQFQQLFVSMKNKDDNRNDVRSRNAIYSTLRYINLSFCRQIENLDFLKQFQLLEKIDLSSCRKIVRIEPGCIPLSVKELILDDCSSLSDISGITDTMQSLSLSKCFKVNFNTLINIKHLRYLNLSECNTIIDEIPALPDSCISLNLSGCVGIKYLSNLPRYLRDLDISGCVGIHSLGVLPDSLRKLRLVECANVEDISNLPRELRVLSMARCAKIKSIKGIPDGLEALFIYGMNNFDGNLMHLPRKNLRDLSIILCDRVRDVEGLPNTLRRLCLSRCYNIHSIERLPDNLISLDLSGCKGLVNQTIKKPSSVLRYWKPS